MRVPWRTRRNLAERLRPYVRPLQPSEPMVAADPIRTFLYRWMIETGDSVEVIAKGFDLDPGLVAAILSGQVRWFTATEERRMRVFLAIGDGFDQGTEVA